MARGKYKQKRRVTHAADHLIAGKSDATRAQNIATEVKAGKPPAQAEAIAYHEQRAAQDGSGSVDHLRALHQIADTFCK